MNTPPRPSNPEEQATPVAEWSPVNTPPAKQNDQDSALTQPLPSVGPDSAKTVPMEDFDGHSSPATPYIGQDGNVSVIPEDGVRQRLDFDAIEDPDMPPLERASERASAVKSELPVNGVKSEPLGEAVSAANIQPIAANDSASVNGSVKMESGMVKRENSDVTEEPDAKRIKKGGYYYKYCKYKNKYLNLFKKLSL